MGEACLPALGCIPSPPDTCETGSDCTRGNECYGTWSCQPEFGCQFLAPPECSDDNDCTDDLCDIDAGMCVYIAPLKLLLGEKFVVSTTRVSPSHRPRESPFH